MPDPLPAPVALSLSLSWCFQPRRNVPPRRVNPALSGPPFPCCAPLTAVKMKIVSNSSQSVGNKDGSVTAEALMSPFGAHTITRAIVQSKSHHLLSSGPAQGMRFSRTSWFSLVAKIATPPGRSTRWHSLTKSFTQPSNHKLLVFAVAHAVQ